MPTDCVWTLNRDMNTAIKKAQGELIISWQDYTYAKPDALEKFWFHYKQNPKAVISGVGNKYEDSSLRLLLGKTQEKLLQIHFILAHHSK